jgi:hypothetical protein
MVASGASHAPGIVPDPPSSSGSSLFLREDATWAAPPSAPVSSVFGRTGAVVAATNDYTWAQVNKATSSIADITTRSAADLSSGTLPDARFPATLPAASGANLTALNGSNVSSGTVAAARLPATTVYTGQANTFGAFLQTFQSGANLNLVDPTDTTKKAQFDLSNIATGTTRTINVPNANSTMAQSIAAVSHFFLTSMSAQGVFAAAQPAFSDISGTASTSQIPSLDTSQITTGTFADARIASAATWNGKQGSLDGAWTSYTPTVTAGTGTITTVGTLVCAYKLLGNKTVQFRIQVDITTNGTGATTVKVTLPFSGLTTVDQVVFGMEVNLTGKGLRGYIAGGTPSTVNLQYANDNSYPGANGARLIASGIYEIP